MARDGPDAVRLLNVGKTFGDTYADVSAWAVPPSDRYPEGVKYSMQYGETEGDAIFRYDNFPDHHEEYRHHKHTPDGEVEPVDDFTGVFPLYERFKQEVRDNGEHWPDD